MERMVHLYSASTDYVLENVREALSATGVPSLLFRNEIPLRYGFNFGANLHCAEVYVKVDDERQARLVLARMLDSMGVADHGCERIYTPYNNARGYWSLIGIKLAGYGLFALAAAVVYQGSQLILLLVCGGVCAILGSLFYAYRAPAWRIVKAIAEALPLLLALPLWLGYELLRWCWDKLAHPVPWTRDEAE
jgi:hypothetical protein